MSKYLILCFVLAISGCTTMQSRATFPEVPAKLMEAPGEPILLETLLKNNDASIPNSAPSEVPLSEISKITAKNNTLTNVLREQVLMLQEWIREQQRIYNKK